MERTDDGVCVVDGDGSYIGERLDLVGDLFALLVVEVETQLGDTGFDRVPACETGGEVDVAGETKVFGVEDFVCGGVVEDCDVMWLASVTRRP